MKAYEVAGALERGEIDENSEWVAVEQTLEAMRSDETVALVAKLMQDYMGDEDATDLAREILHALTTPRLVAPEESP